jgi:putative hydrolase of the HAD superfamily
MAGDTGVEPGLAGGRRPKIEAVIFDLGHTLMHLDGTWPEVFERGVADLAAFVERQRLGLDGLLFAQALLQSREDGFAQAKETQREVQAERTMRRVYASFGLPDPDPALVRGSIDAFFAYEKSRWYADPEAIPVLQELAGRGMRLGLFSNATDDLFIQGQVDRLGFRPWLDPALTSAGTGIRKPDPTAFAPILAAWALPASAVVMVGDTLEADILGAQRAGMYSVWFPSRDDANQEDSGPDDGTSRRGTIQPDATIRCLDELPTLLREL